MNRQAELHLFQAFGIELEYMIVDAASLAVRPIADELLRQVAGGYQMEVRRGPVAWSNELALHLIELKTNGPAASLTGLATKFQHSIAEIHRLLAPLGARLMPGAMHPRMDPARELRLWPHEDNEIYRALHRVFDCRGHGWANLQSTHINLPFAGDEEFGRLHAAIRLILPLLPALAASSPLVEGRATGLMDNRLEFYRLNAAGVPSVTAAVVPEPVFTRRAYEARVLEPIYRDLAPLDPASILRHEWINARGAIARFDRGSIEIRLLDIQECPQADLAIAAATSAAVEALVEERLCDHAAQRAWSEHRLHDIFLATLRDGDRALIRDRDYLAALGCPEPGPCLASELWRHLIEATLARRDGYAEWRPALELILRQGCLARRIVATLGEQPSEEQVEEVYRELCECVEEGRMFGGVA